MTAIIGAHTVIYSSNAEKDAAILRDVLGIESFDAGGALLFRLPFAEVQAHPAPQGGRVELYLLCRDVESLMGKMKDNGLVCSPVQNTGWGLLTATALPGGAPLRVYQPLYPTP